MAQEFLHQLLQMKNRVQDVHDKEERCSICLEEYGTLSRETGTIEVEMRLPCNHCTGSACIAIWLKDHNSCPICRREFFPAQPRPYLEHGIMEDDEEEDDEEDIIEDVYEGVIGRRNPQDDLMNLIDHFCHKLLLGYDISALSLSIAQKLSESFEWGHSHSAWCIAAVSVYIASFLSREPRSPRHVDEVSGVGEDHLRSLYEEIYPQRESLADADMLLPLISSGDARLLNWPTQGSEATNAEIESGYVPQLSRRGCEEGCNELGLDTTIVELSNVLAGKMHDFLHDLRAVTGVAILVASYCMGNATPTFDRVAEIVGTPRHYLRSSCRYASECRDQFMTEEVLQYVNADMIEAVFIGLCGL